MSNTRYCIPCVTEPAKGADLVNRRGFPKESAAADESPAEADVSAEVVSAADVVSPGCSDAGVSAGILAWSI